MPPQGILDPSVAGPAVDAGMPGEYAFDVAVENGAAPAESQCGHGRGGGAADAGQGANGLGGIGKMAAIPLGNPACCGVEIACPAVVAEPAPEREHIVFGSAGERGQIGKARNEAFEVADNGGDLRLLQHDLGQPDAIGIAIALPGQVVAAMLALPGHDAVGEGFHPGRVAPFAGVERMLGGALRRSRVSGGTGP